MNKSNTHHLFILFFDKYTLGIHCVPGTALVTKPPILILEREHRWWTNMQANRSLVRWSLELWGKAEEAEVMGNAGGVLLLKNGVARGTSWRRWHLSKDLKEVKEWGLPYWKEEHPSKKVFGASEGQGVGQLPGVEKQEGEDDISEVGWQWSCKF